MKLFLATFFLNMGANKILGLPRYGIVRGFVDQKR